MIFQKKYLNLQKKPKNVTHYGFSNNEKGDSELF